MISDQYQKIHISIILPGLFDFDMVKATESEFAAEIVAIYNDYKRLKGQYEIMLTRKCLYFVSNKYLFYGIDKVNSLLLL